MHGENLEQFVTSSDSYCAHFGRASQAEPEVVVLRQTIEPSRTSGYLLDGDLPVIALGLFELRRNDWSHISTLMIDPIWANSFFS